MALAGSVSGDYQVLGRLIAQSLSLATPSVNNAMITSDANIAGTKVQGKHKKTLSQAGTVVAATQYVAILGGATGAVMSVRAAITETIATGADRTVTIDVQKSTGAGAFGTILTSTIVFNDGSVLRTVSTATINDTTLVAGDILKITVAVAGAAGNQAQGLVVEVEYREDV